jgi:hypothetical protein
MKEALCATLITTQLIGAWLAIAQTNTDAAKKQQ